jgi:hypothetical protein
MLNFRQLGEVALLATAGIVLLLVISLCTSFILSHIALITLMVLIVGAGWLYSVRRTVH